MKTAETDGTNSVYLVMGEDGDIHGVFLKRKEAEHLKAELKLEYEYGSFYINSHTIGPARGLEWMMQNYKE